MAYENKYVYGIEVNTPAENIIMTSVWNNWDDAFMFADSQTVKLYPTEDGYEGIWRGGELTIYQNGVRCAIYKILRFDLH